MIVYLLIGSRQKKTDDRPRLVIDPKQRVFASQEQGIPALKEMMKNNKNSQCEWDEKLNILTIIKNNGTIEKWGIIPHSN